MTTEGGMTTPELGASNLAWPPQDEDAAFATLVAAGATCVEVAPTRIAAWEDLTPERLARYRAKVSAAGLGVSSLQAMFFNRPDASLLGEPAGFEAMCEHMRLLADVAGALGARVGVFGSPRNRLRGELPQADAIELAAERFRKLGDIAAQGGLTIGIEPVPARYGADFLTSFADVVDMTRRVDHAHVRAHLDSACVYLGGDDIAQAVAAAAPWLAHYHIAEPDLAGFAHPVCDHDAAAAALARVGYPGKIVIEMKQAEDPLGSLREALDFARRRYFARPAT